MTSTETPDWTAHDGRSNSSPEFHAITAVIEDIIRSSAHTLISGRADTVAGTILATLAHKEGLRPGGAEPSHLVPDDLRAAIVDAVPHQDWCRARPLPEDEPGPDDTCVCERGREHTADAVLPVIERHVAAAIERGDRELDEALRERDEAQEIADRLAYSIAPQEVIGEHSSGNFPWLNALDLTPRGGWQAAVERARGEGAAEVERVRAPLAAERLDEFHRRPGCDVPQPAEPSIDVPGVLDRLKYIEDEVAELREAVEAGDLPGVLKELADVAYVVYGMAWRCNFPLDAAIAEVHRSNMTKTPTPGDGKALKGPGYSPADMAAVLAAGGEQHG